MCFLCLQPYNDGVDGQKLTKKLQTFSLTIFKVKPTVYVLQNSLDVDAAKVRAQANAAASMPAS